MAVRVTRGEKPGMEQTIEISQGEYWEVDKNERLLVFGGEGGDMQVAEFRNGQWNTVILVTEEGA